MNTATSKWKILTDSRGPLLFELFWPATAGNVAWSFYTVLVKGWHDISAEYISSLLVLALLSLYLASNWLRAREHDVGAWYFWADFMHTATIILFSIALTEDKPWAPLVLVAMFSVTVVGHMTNAWKSARPEGAPWWPLALANAVGIAVLFGFYRCVHVDDRHWMMPASVAAVLAFWLLVRIYLNTNYTPRIPRREEEAAKQRKMIREIVSQVLKESKDPPATSDAPQAAR